MSNPSKPMNIGLVALSLVVGLATIYTYAYVAGKGWKKATT